ncbi:MAG: M3 family metallopeptidase, partial [Alphaproteobacteria bacterium]
EKASTGRGAWNRLFDETMAELRFDVDGKALTNAEVLNMLSSTDRAERKAAGEAVGKTLGDNGRLFAQITNTLAKDKAVEDKWRNYAKPISSRNLANQVEDEVVEALVDAVREAYPALSHRYYKLKAKWFGQDHLDYFDRNAPLPDSDDRTISWQEAETTVLDAYAAFSPELADVARPFFEKPWIDAPARAGKSPGAFAHPTVPSAHPYLLVNYQGKTRDVMTLAHELGHGVHQRLAAGQGHFLAQTPLTLAETASVFGEMLTFQKLLAETTDAKSRRTLLASKTEDMLNTVVRQIAMLQFERVVHNERRDGEISAERLGEIWMETQHESLGPTLRFDDGYKWFWSYIP